MEDILTKFTDELESFDYITTEQIKELREYIIKESNNDIELKDTFDRLYRHRDVLIKFKTDRTEIMTKRNLSKTTFKFLESIKLFKDILDFSVFKEENKNTKKTIVNYLSELYEIVSGYQTSSLSNIGSNNNGQDVIQNLMRNSSGEDVLQNLMGNSSGEDVLQNLMGLMNNGGMQDIMNKVTNKLQETNTDPMTLLMSMMTGKMNGSQDSLIGFLSDTVKDSLEHNPDLKDTIDKTVNAIHKKS
jgi:hypothetical protein